MIMVTRDGWENSTNIFGLQIIICDMKEKNRNHLISFNLKVLIKISCE